MKLLTQLYESSVLWHGGLSKGIDNLKSHFSNLKRFLGTSQIAGIINVSATFVKFDFDTSVLTTNHWQQTEWANRWKFILNLAPGAPEAVWQVWRPPYQSKIWYGDAIPIKSKAANLFIICNMSRIKTSAFYMFLSHEFWAVTEVAKIQSTRIGLK